MPADDEDDGEHDEYVLEVVDVYFGDGVGDDDDVEGEKVVGEMEVHWSSFSGNLPSFATFVVVEVVVEQLIGCRMRSYLRHYHYHPRQGEWNRFPSFGSIVVLRLPSQL